MSKKQRKTRTDRVKKAIKSGGQKIATFAKSRVVRRFIPVLGRIAIITPGKAMALDGEALNEAFKFGGRFGVNSSLIVSEHRVMKEVVRTGVSSISDSGVRAVVSTAGSIAAMAAGISCSIGLSICISMGWKTKAMMFLHGAGVCAGITSGVYEADPINPLTLPGKVTGDAVDKMSA